MSNKFPKIPHFPFSPGVSRDDRINPEYWNYFSSEPLTITEKLDGENTCISRNGVYARTHSVITQNPWADYLKPIWATIKNDLGSLEIFGENLYAVHSIEYKNLGSYFYVFGAREGERWLEWEEVKHYAERYGFPTVPVLDEAAATEEDEKEFRKKIERYAAMPSLLGGEREGIVARLERGFDNHEFGNSIAKWVRKNHIKTDKHWTRSWKKANLSKNQ